MPLTKQVTIADSQFYQGEFELITASLEYPEGPVYLKDGSILLVDIKAQTLVKVSASGESTIVAHTGGGPNGLAIGPDGHAYICNCGGFTWMPVPIPPKEQVLNIGTTQPADYKGGLIQKVDLATGDVTTLYTETSKIRRLDMATMQWTVEESPTPFELKGPDDIVFDELGNFWFTDWGKSRELDRDITGIYYAKADGSEITQMVFPLNAPNGIGLSPDGKRLYTVETYTGQVLYWELSAPGKIKPNPASIDGTYQLYKFGGQAIFDSMAIDSEGNLHIATMLPYGNMPMSNGGISVVSPAGELLEYIEVQRPDGKFAPLPSNICFGGDDLKTAFITLGASGALVKLQTKVAGLKLDFNA
ncbi:SMP-30/gluconolactonase/LRE family protein [Thalassotalea euphylliae]|uniref:SMP-30/gluconolactonase/LRE family protein n=1 Tax=Thalassotalea euphylliae TaxID=1655234 RepID=UPI00362D4003